MIAVLAPTRRASIVRYALATIALGAGYGDLAVGGTTLASFLLVAAYALLIPIAILGTPGMNGERVPTRASRTRGAPVPKEHRPSYGAAAVASLVVFALYLATLAPSTALWDASEYITAAYVLGIPHPPGNPFFVLLGNLFTHLPVGGNVAQRVNLLAAVCSSVSAGLWFLVAERVLAGWLAARWERWIGGALAAFVGATAFTVWNQSVVNEKVYTVSLLFFAVVSWLMVLWCDEPAGRRADRLLVLVAYLLGLGYSNHPAGFLVGPAVAIAVLARRWTTLLRWRLLLAGAAALVIGLTPFAQEPIRAAHFPAINEGEPTACTAGFKLDCTLSAETWTRLRANIERVQYGGHSVLDRQASFPAQMQMWWLYFRWQWLRDAHGSQPALQTLLALVFLALGAAGGIVHWRRDRRSFWFYGPLVFSVTVALVFYMNFKYGYSQAPELGAMVEREVRDRDYFYIWSFSTWSVWIALGIVGLWQWLAGRIAVGTELPVGRRDLVRRAITAPVLALALIPLIANWKQASRARDTIARDLAYDLLSSVEPYGVLVTYGDNDTFPLWYLQHVEGVRKDVTVAVLSLLNTDWYARQELIRKPHYEFEPDSGPSVYRGRAWPRPPGNPISLTIAEADSIPAYVALDGPRRLVAGGLTITIDPRRLEYGVLQRSDMLVLRMIREAADTGRPFYFSRTTGGYAESLGFDSNLLTQGLARKVLYTPTVPGRDTVLVVGAGLIDVARSNALWKEFRGPAAIVRRGDWVDRASADLARLYLSTGITLGGALDQLGDARDVARTEQTTRSIAAVVWPNTSLEEIFGVREPNVTAPAGDAVRLPAAP